MMLPSNDLAMKLHLGVLRMFHYASAGCFYGFRLFKFTTVFNGMYKLYYFVP